MGAFAIMMQLVEKDEVLLHGCAHTLQGSETCVLQRALLLPLGQLPSACCWYSTRLNTLQE